MISHPNGNSSSPKFDSLSQALDVVVDFARRALDDDPQLDRDEARRVIDEIVAWAASGRPD